MSAWRATSAGEKCRAARAGRGFTLVEILVVTAILVILFGLLFVPLYQSFNIVRQSQARVIGQQRLTYAINRLTQDLQEAMYVVPGPLVTVTGVPANNVPAAAVPAYLDLILPEMDDEGHVIYPLRKSRTVVRWYVAPLPGQPGPGSGYSGHMWGRAPGVEPRMGYLNPFEQPFHDLSEANMCTLYRAVFNLDEDPWSRYPASLSYDDIYGAYFYARSTTVNGRPIGEFWEEISEPMTPTENADVAIYVYDTVRGVHRPLAELDSEGYAQAGVAPVPGLSLSPAMEGAEQAQPNNNTEPTAYKTKRGNWAHDPAHGIMALITFFNTPGGSNIPQIVRQIYADGTPGPNDPGGGRRVFNDGTTPGWTIDVDPVTGTVKCGRNFRDRFFYRLPDGTPVAANDPANTLRPRAGVPYMFQVSYGGNVTDFGSVAGGNSPPRRLGWKIVEYSETVRCVKFDGATQRVVRFRRTKGDPGPGEYRIDYNTGVITFNRLNPPGRKYDYIDVRYKFRDNFEWVGNTFRNDVVLVTYGSWQKIDVTLHMAVYDVATGTPQVLKASTTVALRNELRYSLLGQPSP